MLAFRGAALVSSSLPACSTVKGIKLLWSHPASRWTVTSGCERFAAANARKESTSVTSKVYIAVDFFFFFSWKMWPPISLPSARARHSHRFQAWLWAGVPSSWRKSAGKTQQPSSSKYGKGEGKAFSFSSWSIESINWGPTFKPNWS